MDAIPTMLQKISFIVEHQVTHVEGAIKSLEEFQQAKVSIISFDER